MIRQHILQIKNEHGKTFQPKWGYQFYGVLTKALGADNEFGDKLHSQEISPISQYVRPLPTDNGSGEWTISLMGQSAVENMEKRVDAIAEMHLFKQNLNVTVEDRTVTTIFTVQALIRQALSEYHSDRFTILFHTPTSFKTLGEYALFPTVPLIVNSLVSKWNAVWKTSVIADNDAIEELIRGIRISTYKLQSSYYQIKEIRIPGFVGMISLDAKLPDPLMEIWKPLISFGEYCGIGIKCALGMGGISVYDTALPLA